MLPSLFSMSLEGPEFPATRSSQRTAVRGSKHYAYTLLEVLRTALKMTEKTVNEFAYFIQRGAILIVCQSADAKYPQNRFLSASRFSAFLFDRNGVTGKSGSTGAT
jgi:hypothetical protein